MASPAQKMLLEVVGVVALVAALEAVQQMKDAASPLRLALAEAWEATAAVVRLRWNRATVAEEMYQELDLIYEGGLS